MSTVEVDSFSEQCCEYLAKDLLSAVSYFVVVFLKLIK